MNTSKRVLGGALWVYGAQLVTVLAQFGYAAITSRAVTPANFGAYSVALAVTALVTLLSNGGLAQTISRVEVIDRKLIRSLFFLAILMGACGAGVLLITAEFWATFWGQPDASEPIQWLSISGLLAPSLGLATGLLRRLGRYKVLATATVVGNLAGMVTGTVAVSYFHSASSLLVSPITAQAIILVVAFLKSDRLLFGLASLKNTRAELGFSVKVVLNTVLAYASGNVGKWSISVGLGASALGQWNRADVVTLVPFQQIQSALIQAIYPEFRHDRKDGTRAKTVWPDLLGLVAWGSVPAAFVAAVILPTLIPYLFGPGWEVAALLSIPLALAGGMQTTASLLANALEAIGEFKWIWIAQGILVLINFGAALASLQLKSWIPIVLAPLIGIVIQHLVHMFAARTLGYLNIRTLLKNYVGVGIASALAAFATWSLVQLFHVDGLGPWVWVCVATSVAAIILSIWMLRKKFPPYKIARRYGLFG
jgi:O-antigen/teichoic acid export membrane protein